MAEASRQSGARNHLDHSLPTKDYAVRIDAVFNEAANIREIAFTRKCLIAGGAAD
jgi:hypothetical protein